MARQTSSSTTARTRSTRSTLLWITFITVLIVATAFANLALTQRNDHRDYSPHSLDPHGSAALATLLRNQGNTITHVQTSSQLAQASANTTVLITDPSTLNDKTARRLITSGATVILLGSATTWPGDSWGFSDDTWTSAYYRENEESDQPHKAAISETHCPGNLHFIDTRTHRSTLAPVNQIIIGTDPAHSCFHTRDGSAIAQSSTYPNIFYFGASYALTNEYLDQADNAGIVVRMLSTHTQILWVEGYIEPDTETAIDSPMPQWLESAFIALALSTIWFAFWRGRRYGRLVPEPLPVVVPADEINQGRTHLYRSSRDPAHAAHVLRAAFIARHAPFLGINTQTPPDAIVQACANATGESPKKIKSALYTYPVTHHKDLTHVASTLGELEKEFAYAYQR